MDIAIIEDLQTDYETLRDTIKDYLFEYKIEYIIHWFQTGEDFLGSFKPDKYNLIFVDMLLGNGITGLNVAKEVRVSGCQSPIVFTTSERDYALDGYEVQAIDYLIKPYNPERIQVVIKRVMSTYKTRKYLAIQVGRETCCICTDELLWAESSDHYMDLHMSNNDIIHASMQFKEILEILPSQLQFQCCYRGIVINLEYVDSFQGTEFLLQNGQTVPISRSKREKMRKCLCDYAIWKTREEMNL